MDTNKIEISLTKMRELPPRTDAEIEEWKWLNESIPHLEASGLPQRFHRRITDWNPEQLAVFNECQSKLTKTGAIVALVGKRGAGKTTIAAQIAVSRASNPNLPPWHRRPPYRKLVNLVARFKPMFSDFGSIDMDSLLQYAESFCKDHPLVIIDEIHDCEDQKMKDRVLTDFLDRRYANMVDTILISNQTPEEFQNTIGDSILSRLTEYGAILACNWESFRGRKKHPNLFPFRKKGKSRHPKRAHISPIAARMIA